MAPPSLVHTSPPRFRTRLGLRLASPLSVLVLVPALVVGVGAFMAVSGQTSLRASIDTMAEARFIDQTAQASRHIRDMLGQADPLLDGFRAFVREQETPPTPFDIAEHLSTSMHDRSGLSFVSLGSTEGHLTGVFLDDGGRFWLTDRQLGEDGRCHLRDFRIPAVGPPILEREDPDCGYDVRTRPFYDLAIERGRRTWTEPYVFFDSGVPGVTRAEPLLGSDGALLGVLSADFNLNDLSDFVDGLDTVPSGRVFVYTAAGEVLAHPGVRRIFGQDARGAGELLRVADLDDPVLAGFFAHQPELSPDATEALPFVFEEGDGPYLAAVAPCVVDADMIWYVGALAPESAFMAPAREHLVGAVRISAVALVLALAVASLFAVNLVRSRREVSQARAAARAARKEVRELGSYRLLRRIGEGGMGEVWLAEHRLLARPAAIKLVHGKAIADESRDKVAEILAGFEKEARVTANLASPHTVRLFDYGVSRDGVFFYVMELLDGVDLQALVDHWGPQPLGRVVRVLDQVCSSLAEAHDAGLVHLDIKPANVFLCRQGDEADVGKVLDFGLVKVHVEGREDGQLDDLVAGTPAYMSPERGLGRTDVDARADLYSVGCLAFWLLTGRTVFDTDQPTVMLRHHVNTPPQRPSEVSARPVPLEMDHLVLQCLAKDPAVRPQDAREMRQLLAEVPIPEDQEWGDREIRAWWAEHGELVQLVDSASKSQEGKRLVRGTTEVMLEPVDGDTQVLDRTVDKLEPSR